MKHLTKTDFILCAADWQFLSDQAVMIKDHVGSCHACKTEVAQVNHLLNSFRILNNQQCDQFLGDLVDFLQQPEPVTIPAHLQVHLAECEICNRIFQSIPKASSHDLIEIPTISPEILHQIDTRVYAELEKLVFTNYLTQTATTLTNKIEETWHTFELFLIPTPELCGTRGKNRPEFFIFTHKGGKIRLQIGLANTDIRLFGIFKEKIYSIKSDLTGNADFVDLPKDDYRVEVKGYDITNIKTIL